MQKRIFVTDDDPGMQDIFRLILEKAGYITTIYEGGKQLLGNNDVPDIYLLDKNLSGMDGLDICRHLKGDNKTKQIPVIIISASPDLSQLSAEAGADGFIEKPFLKAKLLATIEKHLAKSIVLP